jgi:hypothetical protein
MTHTTIGTNYLMVEMWVETSSLSTLKNHL